MVGMDPAGILVAGPVVCLYFQAAADGRQCTGISQPPRASRDPYFHAMRAARIG